VRLAVTKAADPASKDALARQRLRQLGAAQPEGIDRKAIEAALNPTGRPSAERVSKKIWERVLAELTEAGAFKTFKRGNADLWRWIGDDEPGGDDDVPF
jgi:hypothetical protein